MTWTWKTTSIDAAIRDALLIDNLTVEQVRHLVECAIQRHDDTDCPVSLEGLVKPEHLA